MKRSFVREGTGARDDSSSIIILIWLSTIHVGLEKQCHGAIPGAALRMRI